MERAKFLPPLIQLLHEDFLEYFLLEGANGRFRVQKTKKFVGFTP